MAAPITPVKTIVEIGKSEFCLLCKNESKRLHCLTKFKATKEDYVKKIQQFTGQTLELSLLHSTVCVCVKVVYLNVKMQLSSRKCVLTTFVNFTTMCKGDKNVCPKHHHQL